MIQTRFKFLNIFVISILLYVTCSIQTSFWKFLSDSSPSPQLWLLIILYLVLYRGFYEAAFLAYFYALIVKSFSSVPLGIIWPTLILLIAPASYIKSRMFWPSLRYFVFTSIGFIFAYHIVYLILSFYLESNSTPISFFNRFLEIILTSIFAAPIYWTMSFIDKLTLPEIVDNKVAASE